MRYSSISQAQRHRGTKKLLIMLHEITRVLKKRFLIIFLVFWIVMVIAAIFTFSQKPLYKATAGVVLNNRELKNNTFKILYDDLIIKTAEMLEMLDEHTSSSQKKDIVEFLKSSIDARMDTSLPVLQVCTIATEAEPAALLANTHAIVFIKYFTAEKASTVDKQRAALSQALTVLERNISSMTDRSQIKKIEQGLRKRLLKIRKERERLLKTYTTHHPRIILLDRTLRDITNQLSLAKKQREFLDRYAHAIKRSLSLPKQQKSKDVLLSQYLIPAKIPVKTFYQNMHSNFLIGIFVALLLGIFAAVIIEYLDTSLGSYSEVESFLHIPVLASIPHIERRKKTITEYLSHVIIHRKRDALGEQRSRLLFFQPRESPVAYSYQKLIHNLDVPQVNRGTAILFISSENREGKSVTAANCAITSAFSGIKTLLIDADFRFSIQHSWFGLPRTPGLSDVLSQQCNGNDVIHSGTECRCTTSDSHNKLLEAGLKNLFLITSGSKVTNPELLFLRGGIDEVLLNLKQAFPVIIIDSPSVLHFNETLHISRCVEKKIMVYRSGRLSRGLLKQAVAEITNASGSVDGLIINDVI